MQDTVTKGSSSLLLNNNTIAFVFQTLSTAVEKFSYADPQYMSPLHAIFR